MNLRALYARTHYCAQATGVVERGVDFQRFPDSKKDRFR
jgi:hypothetical protein